MPHSFFYDKYLQSYDFYCNSIQHRIFAGCRVKKKEINVLHHTFSTLFFG